MTNRCTVCGTRATRDLVDAALLAGDRPADILRRYPDLVSSSALYRHARAHKPVTALAVTWLGDTSSGDLIADLAAQRRSHIVQRDAALERGDSNSAAREGHEATSIALALLKSAFPDDTAAAQLAYADRITRATQRATRNRPEHADELAAAAAELEFADLAQDARDLAASARSFRSTLEKESA
jgi:hypothetical protein